MIINKPFIVTQMRACVLAAVLFTTAISCGGDEKGNEWQVVVEDLPGALLSVWGTSSTDVWTVGGDARDGTGPQVLHYDGKAWERIQTSETQGNLWWVFGFKDGPIFMGGDGGVILRYENKTFTKMTTPRNGTVFGLWGAAPDDMWAVGSVSPSSGGFAWRLNGDEWIDEPSFPSEIRDSAAMWKVFGRSANDAFVVGGKGTALHWDGSALSAVETGASTSLFNISCNTERYVAVGGDASGVILEYDGQSWTNVTPEFAPGLSGVSINEAGEGYAVGQYGMVFERANKIWQEVDIGILLNYGLHGSWLDPDGGFWAVGGQTFVAPLTNGLILHHGKPVETAGF